MSTPLTLMSSMHFVRVGYVDFLAMGRAAMGPYSNKLNSNKLVI